MYEIYLLGRLIETTDDFIEAGEIARDLAEEHSWADVSVDCPPHFEYLDVF